MNRISLGSICIIFLLLFISVSSRGQAVEFSQEIRFIQYLVDKEQFTEADFLLSKLDQRFLNPAQTDTLNYVRGWSAYTNKKLDTAINALSRVSPAFPFYTKSHFFAAYSAVFLGRRDTAKLLLGEMTSADSVATEMKSFELSGIALLSRDYSHYKSLKNDFTYAHFALQKEEQRFAIYYDKLTGYTRRSPFLAGVYSALLPGAGKFYAGKKKQGIASFLPILSLGVVAYESYRKSGIRSARTIAFGSLFSVFYIGNIWGSVLSVKIKEKEFYREYDNKILFDLHIPLRNLYN